MLTLSPGTCVVWCTGRTLGRQCFSAGQQAIKRRCLLRNYLSTAPFSFQGSQEKNIESRVRVAQVSKSMQYTGDILEVLPIPFYASVDVFVTTLHLTYQTPCICFQNTRKSTTLQHMTAAAGQDSAGEKCLVEEDIVARARAVS